MRDRIDLDSHVIAKPLFSAWEKWGRLDTPHGKGLLLYPLVDTAIKELMEAFEGDHTYLFQPTPGGMLGAEKLFFHHYLYDVRETGKNQFISSITEEASILKGLGLMEQLGCGVKLAPVDDQGRIDLMQFEKMLGPKTGLVSISAVCPVTGVMQPVESLITLCHSRHIKIHVNVTHAVGTWGVSLKEWGADYLSFDGDKLGAPSGMGGLFSKEAVFIEPHPSLILTLNQVVKEKIKTQEQFAMESARRRSVFEKELLLAFPDVQIIGKEVERAPHILAIHFPGITDEALLYFLYKHRIDASIGGGPFQTVKAVLKASGKSYECGGLSLAFSPYLQEDDLAYVLDMFIKGVHKLKKMQVHL
ncbi:aminotransferase class V-fold PLP-dependent enzyme [Rhabdochlamydiaceae symbiont of Dictyostelium giganteum]|uniref:aminotransferase class V-fold PLP-dependent enzyme n=1 Tax=Rhabdochlamydiaceae symbiont of Dictyostelium giganteum TaxID=3342349 RepID=UPI00385131E7